MAAAVFHWPSHREDAAGLTVSEKAAAELGMEHQMPLILRVGRGRVVTSLLVDPALPPDAVLVGAAEAHRLGIASPLVRRFTFRLKASASNELRLGPVIGILLGRTREEIRQNRHGFRPFEMPWNIRLLGGIVYYFSLDDIDWDNHRVLGHVYIPEQVPLKLPPARLPLETALFPFPDVIYRRRSIPYEQLARIKAEMTPYIFNNPRASHKLRQVAALRRVPSLAAHLPETRELSSAHVLNAMLRRYPAVFVKRSGMGAGRGVFHVTRLASGGYRLTFRESTRTTHEVQQDVTSYADLTTLLSRLTGYAWRSSAWCVQQALQPARWRDRPFDLRVIVQKDGQGRWRVNGSYIRVAPDPASLLSRRGDYLPSERFFSMKWGSKGTPFLSEIFALACRCAAALDEALGPLGDLGMDFLIDEADRVWFLEANAGPGYLMLGPDDRDYWNQLSAPLAFASYLAGFPTVGDDDSPNSSRGVDAGV